MRTHSSLGLLAPLLLLAACVLPPTTPLAPATSQPPGPGATSLVAPGPSPAAAVQTASPAAPTAPAGTAAPPASAAGATAQPISASGAVPASWQTYSNSQVGFSMRYPPGWSQTPMAQAETGLVSGEGVAVEGPEGRVELTWGMGFGGACNAYSALHVAQGQLATCYSVAPDGIRNWNQIYKILPTTGWGARAFTKNANEGSADLVLAVLATLPSGGLRHRR